MPCGVMLSYKSWGKKEEEGHVCSNSICLSKKLLEVMNPDLLDLLEV